MLLATYVRESPDIKLGISLKRENGSLIVSNVPEWGVVAMQTDIRVGHRLLQINNMNCADMSAEEAVLILRDAIGTVILAVDDDIPNNNNNKDMLHTIPLAAAVPVSTPTPMVTATRTAQQHPGTGNAPLGREEGGIWGTNNYIGNVTSGAACVGCLCFCLPGLLILLCPCDERDAYKVNGSLYDAEGRLIGREHECSFVPRRQQPMTRQ